MSPGFMLFFLGDFHIYCDVETVGSSYIGVFAGWGFGSSVLQIKKLSAQYLSVHLLKRKKFFIFLTLWILLFAHTLAKIKMLVSLNVSSR